MLSSISLDARMIWTSFSEGVSRLPNMDRALIADWKGSSSSGDKDDDASFSFSFHDFLDRRLFLTTTAFSANPKNREKQVLKKKEKKKKGKGQHR